jgi:hypothetical protein
LTLAENLHKKYALTSLKLDGGRFPRMAINEALETAAQIADQENAPHVASRIRSLKWLTAPVQSDLDAA